MSRPVRMIGSGRAEVACKNCDARSTVENDAIGVGSNAVAKCHACQVDLCGSCLGRCVGCDQPICRRHSTTYDRGDWCPCCMAQIAAEGDEALLAEQTGVFFLTHGSTDDPRKGREVPGVAC